MKRVVIRLIVLLVSLAGLSSIGSAYYAWVYYPGINGPFTPIRAKFDLSSLPDSHTVSYFISDQGPNPMMPGDSLQALVSEIRLAAETWNGVSSSTLKLAFGGFFSSSTQQTSAGIDVVFDDSIPPGLLAQTTLTTPADLSFLASGASFVPIKRARVQLRKDLTAYRQASFYDDFFLTITHELGHAQGLQHTLTSGVMSTSVTRATTKAQPLAPDDIAGISLLYPVAGYLAGTGSISGTVSLSGKPVNMASVVALSASGVAISSLTNPDGTYRIDGITPGQYYLYVHPLPPAAQGEGYPDNVVPPQDAKGDSFPANTGFGTQFYTGTRDWTQSPTITVTAGNVVSAMNFNVQARNGPALYDMATYNYLGSVGVQAGPLQPQTQNSVLFYANGALVNNNTQLAPGLNVTVVGGPAQVEQGGVSVYNQYVLVYLDTFALPSASPAPISLAVTVANDLYVLPAAFTVVPSPGPTISGVIPGTDNLGNPTATISGANIGPNSRVLFDGARANVAYVNQDGSLVVSAPPASAGYQAAVEVLSNDGQTSSQAIGDVAPRPFTFAYSGPSTPNISVSPATVTAGTDMLVRVTGYNTNFVDGRTVVGFGSSDVLVRQVWVLSSGTLLMNISVRPTAQPTSTSVTVTTGLQLSTLTTAFQIQAANPAQASLLAPIVNQATQLAGVPVGGTAVISALGLPQNLTGWTLTISSQQSSFSVTPAGQILASVPGGLLPGPSVVQLLAPDGTSIPSVLMQVDPPPPGVTSVLNSFGQQIGASQPVKPGDPVTVIVAGLADANGSLPAASTIHVNVGGVDQIANTISSMGGQGYCQLQVTLPANLPNGAQTPLTVAVGTRVSSQYFINIQN